MDIFKPSEHVIEKKMGTRQIVEAFIESGLDSAEVDVSMTKRPPDSLYSALHMYLKRHEELGIGVKTVDGKIILCKYEASQ
jgi:hypothetical protein